MKRFRPGTALLVVLILVLGSSLVIRQRREARLRAALALYKSRATGDLVEIMGRSVPMGWPEGTPLGEAIEPIKADHAGIVGFPEGLPIVVDPDGLREAGQSLGSPMRRRRSIPARSRSHPPEAPAHPRAARPGRRGEGRRNRDHRTRSGG